MRGPKKSPRLTQEDWLMAGFRALTEHGPSALKAETLARQMGTTKGSFYWHFKDVPDFHAALLDMWETRAVTEIIALIDGSDAPDTRLPHLLTVAATGAPVEAGGTQLEPAIRAWARGHSQAQATVERIDTRRRAYLDQLCAANPDMPVSAGQTLYAAFVGLQMLDADPRNAVDLLLGLAKHLEQSGINKGDHSSHK